MFSNYFFLAYDIGHQNISLETSVTCTWNFLFRRTALQTNEVHRILAH